MLGLGSVCLSIYSVVYTRNAIDVVPKHDNADNNIIISRSPYIAGDFRPPCVNLSNSFHGC